MRKLGLLIKFLGVIMFIGLAIMTSSANAFAQYSSPQIKVLPDTDYYINVNANSRTLKGCSLSISSDSNTTQINWTASENVTWLSLSNASGTTPDDLFFDINANGLTVGITYFAVIKVTAIEPANTPVTRRVAVTVVEPDHLIRNQSLKKGWYLRSTNKQYKLILQMDGNLVLYNSNNQPLWASNTDGQDVSEFKVNKRSLDIINTAGQVIWTSGLLFLDYYGYGEGQGQKVTVKNEGFIEGRDYFGNLTWSSNKLVQGNKLTPGQELSAAGGAYRLKMQQDGNLVLRNSTGQIVWHSGTIGHPASYCVMQDDGNLVIYNLINQAIWSTGTENPYLNLLVKPDGDLVICHWVSESSIYWDREHGKH